jgi:hypothetical protein
VDQRTNKYEEPGDRRPAATFFSIVINIGGIELVPRAALTTTGPSWSHQPSSVGRRVGFAKRTSIRARCRTQFQTDVRVQQVRLDDAAAWSGRAHDWWTLEQSSGQPSSRTGRSRTTVQTKCSNVLPCIGSSYSRGQLGDVRPLTRNFKIDGVEILTEML